MCNEQFIGKMTVGRSHVVLMQQIGGYENPRARDAGILLAMGGETIGE